MQRSQALYQFSRFCSDTRDVLGTAKRVERIRTRPLDRIKSTVNPYTKAQYITAFLEARSASLMHKSFTNEQFKSALECAEGTALLTIPSAALTPDEGRDCRALNVATLPDRHLRQPGYEVSLMKTCGSSFGAWRETPVRLRKYTRSIDVILHCVIREARTPPELSPEALERVLPLRTQHMQNFMKYLRSITLRYDKQRCTKEVERELLFQRYQQLLDELGVSCNANARRRGVAVWKHMGSSMGVLNLLERNLTSYVIHHLTLSLGWSVALDFLKRVIASWGKDCSRPTLCEDLSQQVAIFAEAVRYSGPGSSLPSLAVLEELLQSCTTVLAGKSPAHGRLVRLSSVLAAPILSILDVNVSDSQKTSMHDLERFFETYLIRHRSSGGIQLQYLPAIAWGEYLRALSRFGASLEKIQKVTDAITNTSLTWSADQLVRSPHVWTGYLACCDAKHALKVYETNRENYGMKESAALTAVLIERLLVPSYTDVELSKASALWAALQSKEHSLIIGSSSMWVAIIHLYLATHKHVNLMKLSVDYDKFLLYFGVDRKWWEAEGGPELFSNAEETFRQYGTTPFRLFFGNVCCGYQFRIPPAVQYAFEKALEDVEANIMGKKTFNDTLMLSPEDIAETMVESN